ncbi:MAG: GNAT family N-acetyltransferase [Actinobacteria bacterium]|jgi:GNAT superfamily N-acetyltransferase|nr:GNAT family N-acetyltransferase [Actinomycetota bacterium]TXH40364.1 MAG: GNAT family N-acetyltransferase [Actinomycetota bacterium]HRY09667.1 GNAT family N-acetyltransferase [Candidatus Nanopelagicales bacterium]
MSELPLGWRTDLDVLTRSGSTITSGDGHLIVRTPANPGYYWGNFLCVTDPGLARRPQECLALMSRAFPDAAHVAIALPAAPETSQWDGLGVDIEHDEVLASDEPPTGRALPTGYSSRPLFGEDWKQSLRNEVAESGAGDVAAYVDFARRRNASRQSMVANGDACFFGAFFGEQLVAELGIVLCDGLARYQSVATVPGHRSRGLASHLLQMAGEWARGHGADRWVIVAEPGADAARLYRACGMRPVDDSWQVFRGVI